MVAGKAARRRHARRTTENSFAPSFDKWGPVVKAAGVKTELTSPRAPSGRRLFRGAAIDFQPGVDQCDGLVNGSQVHAPFCADDGLHQTVHPCRYWARLQTKPAPRTTESTAI